VTRALQAELIKLRTTRTFLALVGSAAGLSLLIIVLITSIDSGLDPADQKDAFALSDASGLFVLLLGAIGMAGEWRHRTIAATVLTVPRRLLLLGSKVIAYAVAGALIALAVNVAVMAVGSLILAARGFDLAGPADMLDVLWRSLTVAALFGGFGVCVGALIRNNAGAIVVLLAIQFVLEPLLFGLAPDVGRFGPLSAAPGAITQAGFDDTGDLLAPGIAVLVMIAWLGVLFAAAAATFTKRDLV
jgi:ABC-type transport system involved in multi-copper enzyme maturation permease subunit